MKPNKLLLTGLTLLPLVLFTIIYVKGSALIPFIFFTLLIIGISLVRQINKRYLPLLTLVGTFLLYSFHGLGGTQAPKTFESFTKKGKIITFAFDQPERIDQFCYYVGIDKTAHYHLEYLDAENQWKKSYTCNEDKFPFSFRWHCHDVNITASKTAFYLDKSEVMLGEVRFMQNGKALNFTSPYPKLQDEPAGSMDTSYYGSTFFDEIYFARTAYEMLHGLPLYENTHPYLGKMLIATGIKAFGMTPFGWRFTNVIFGALMILIAYFFALRIFKEELYAFAMGVMTTYSFMHFTQARVALIDTFGVLFIFVSYLFLYLFLTQQHLRNLLLSGLFFGLASAVKWSALFASVGYLLILIYLFYAKYPLQTRFKGYRIVLYGIGSYLGVASLVYFLTFFDLYLQHGLQGFIDYQINMFNYHAALTSPHAYSSVWWSWPIDFRPMCYYREVVDGISSSITAFGNPALFWTGTVAVIYLIYLYIQRESFEGIFILAAFLGLWLPYAFISRSMFIYHFYYAVPFMFLAILYLWRDLIGYSEKFLKLFFIFLIITVALFLLFYPVMSGHPIPRGDVDSYLAWSNGWWL